MYKDQPYHEIQDLIDDWIEETKKHNEDIKKQESERRKQEAGAMRQRNSHKTPKK